jgi:HipA-like protein
LIFLAGWNCERLAKVFLREADQPAIFGPAPIEPGHDKAPHVLEVGNLDLRDIHAHGTANAHAEKFVLNTVRQIDPCGQNAELGLAGSGAISFTYDPDWLSWEHAMPISLSLPLREEAHQGGPVIAYLENLLPDNQAIRERVAARVRAGGTDAWHMLEKIGRDCVGALQFVSGEIPEVGARSPRLAHSKESPFPRHRLRICCAASQVPPLA